MNRIMLYHDDNAGITGISNVFIDSYMKDANDAQLKIYLYLIRMFSANTPVSVSDMADKFNHTEKDVIRSLQYWERMRLLSLDYDNSKNISGIHILTPVADQNGEPIMKPLASIVTMPPVVNEEKETAMNETAKCAPAKPSYSADQLRTYRNNEEISEMLCIVEQYLGKPLSPADIKSLLYIHLEIGYSMDMLETLLEYCLERGKKEMRYIEKTAIGWYEQGIQTTEQVKNNVSKYDKTIYSIMKALGKRNTPTTWEMDYIIKWTNQYGFSLDLILECCKKTVMAVDSHRFEYADRILTNWKENNVITISDTKELDKAYQQGKLKPATARTSASNRFNQFPQHDYDFEALERDILSN